MTMKVFVCVALFVTLASQLTLSLFLIFISNQANAQPTDSDFYQGLTLPRIAIIGGGVGGATAAYNLKKAMGISLPVIDVYEQHNVGGRLAVVDIAGGHFEAGGTIIHDKNEYMNDFQKKLGLQRLTVNSKVFAIYKGQDRVFEASKYGWLTSLRLLWQYGMSAFTLQGLSETLITDFSRIYQWQNERYAFTTVPNLLLSMSDLVMSSTQNSSRDFLKSHGISDHFVDEVATVAFRDNYGQTGDNLHGLVGLVSLTGIIGPLWRINGGNHQVPENLLKAASVNLIPQSVTKVVNISSDKPLYRIETTKGDAKEYDVVILAHPLIKGAKHPIQFVNFVGDGFPKSEQSFHETMTYFISGVPNHKYFGYSSLHEMPDEIFTVGDNDFFSSMSLQSTVDGVSSANVYKVFANKELTDSQLNSLFTERKEMKLIKWLAYPQYTPKAEFSPFVLAPQLYHINCIETAASAMEMSAVSGVNVASLVVHQWMGNDHLMDNMFVIEEKHIKIEL